MGPQLHLHEKATCSRRRGSLHDLLDLGTYSWNTGRTRGGQLIRRTLVHIKGGRLMMLGTSQARRSHWPVRHSWFQMQLISGNFVLTLARFCMLPHQQPRIPYSNGGCEWCFPVRMECMICETQDRSIRILRRQLTLRHTASKSPRIYQERMRKDEPKRAIPHTERHSIMFLVIAYSGYANVRLQW